VARTLSADTAALAASDPVMAGFVERFGELSVEQRRRARPGGDAYAALLRSVIAQQLSSKAARTIHGRVVELFGGDNPSPTELLEMDPAKLRAAGLSGRKVEYLRDLAGHVLSGELELDRLNELSDEDVIAEITAVRGFGVWSAQMFLMFFLERPDVLPTGDLGIRKAVQLAYDLPQLPEPAELEEIAEPWRPHRTLACLYLWESLHNAPID
jgi:DNA-3-methyladenine glycosylase II